MSSTQHARRRSRSGRQVRTTTSPPRAVARQSIERTSSPTTYSRSESNSVPCPRRAERDRAVELAQPGELLGQVLARRERRQHPHASTARRCRRCRPARPSGPERTARSPAPAARSPRRVGVSAADEPAAFTRAGRRPAASAASRRPTAPRRRAARRAAGADRRWRPASATVAGSPSRTPVARSGSADRSRTPAGEREVDEDAEQQQADADRRTATARAPAARAARRARASSAARPVMAMARRSISAGRGPTPSTLSRTPSAVTPSSSASGRSCDPVPQRRAGQRLDVVRRHVVAAGQPGPRLGGGQQRGRAARRDAQRQRRRLPGGAAQVHDVAEHLGAPPARRARRPGPPRGRPAPATAVTPGGREVARVEAGGGARRAPRAPRPGPAAAP